MVIEGATGKVLGDIPNTPGGEGNVTVVHQDSPEKYTVVATAAAFAGAKTIAVDPATHNRVQSSLPGLLSSSGEGRGGSKPVSSPAVQGARRAAGTGRRRA